MSYKKHFNDRFGRNNWKYQNCFYIYFHRKSRFNYWAMDVFSNIVEFLLLLYETSILIWICFAIFDNWTTQWIFCSPFSILSLLALSRRGYTWKFICFKWNIKLVIYLQPWNLWRVKLLQTLFIVYQFPQLIF